MVAQVGIEPTLGTNQVRTVYKAVGASSYTIGPMKRTLSKKLTMSTKKWWTE